MTYPQFTPEELVTEEWRKLNAYPPYEVSSLGRVRGHRGLLRPHTDRYSLVVLMIQNKRTCFSVHRLVALAFLPPALPEETQINHLDGNKSNNRVVNLERCDQKHNAAHAGFIGLIPVGESSHNAKITEQDVQTIRKAYATGKHHMQTLADNFQISKTQTHRIIKRQTWKHVN